MIMDDSRIMEAAKLIANSSAAFEDQFMRLIQDNGITYNDVIQRGWI